MQRPIAPTLALVLAAVLIGSAITYGITQGQQREVLGKLFMVQEELSDTKEDLLGYTRFTDYMTESKAAISEQMKFRLFGSERHFAMHSGWQASGSGARFARAWRQRPYRRQLFIITYCQLCVWPSYLPLRS